MKGGGVSKEIVCRTFHYKVKGSLRQREGEGALIEGQGGVSKAKMVDSPR